MLKTIIIGSRILVQGIFVRELEDGLIAVRVGKQEFHGRPVAA